MDEFFIMIIRNREDGGYYVRRRSRIVGMCYTRRFHFERNAWGTRKKQLN